MDDSTEEEDGSSPIPTITNAHVVILRTNLSNEEMDKIFLDIAMALRSAGHIVSFLCCHVDAEISHHMQHFDISKVFRWIPSSLFGFFKTPLRLLSSTLILIWLKMFRNYMFPSFVITDSFVVLPVLRQIGVNVVHFYQFDELCRRNNIFCRLMVPFERWFLNHANKILIENRTSLHLIQQIYRVPYPTEVFYLTAAYTFLEQDIDDEQIVISQLPPNVCYFLIFGIYGPKLNCHTLIKSFELLMDKVLSSPCESRKNVYLIISGYVVDDSSQKFFTQLKSYVQQLRHESKILFFKNVGMLIQKYLIAHCTAVLMGDTDITSCSPILECLSVGAVVITAKSDYAEELITNEITGFVIDPMPEKYCELMYKLLEDEIFVGYLKYMIVLDYFNRFSFSAMEQQLQKIVENMANIYNEKRAYRYLNAEACKSYLINTLQLLKDRQMFEREGPMTGNQLKEMLFQMQLQIIQRNGSEDLSSNPANDERNSSEEEVLIIDLDREIDEQNPRDLSSISNMIAAVQLGNLEVELQQGPSGLCSNNFDRVQSQPKTPSPINFSNKSYLARVDPRLNRRAEEPQPGPSRLSTESPKEIAILQLNPSALPSADSSVSGLVNSLVDSQSDLSAFSNILSTIQVTSVDLGLNKQSEDSNPDPSILSSTPSGKLQIEQQLSELYDQFISPDEISSQEISNIVPESPSLDNNNPAPVPIIDKGKRKMGTKIGEGRKKTSKPQLKTSNTTDTRSSRDNKDITSSTRKPSTAKKSSTPTDCEKKAKSQTQSDSVVNKKLPPILNKDKTKLPKTKFTPEKLKPISMRKANLNIPPTLSPIRKTPGDQTNSGNLKPAKPVSRDTTAKPSSSKDKNSKPSEQTASKSSGLPLTGVKIISFPSPKSLATPIHGNRYQATAPINKKKQVEKVFLSSAPVGGVIVTSSGGKVKPKDSLSISVPIIKSRVQTPSLNKRISVDKKLSINLPAKKLEENIKPRTTSSKSARTRKTTTTGNVIPPTTSKSIKKQVKVKTPKTTPNIQLSQIPIHERMVPPSDATTQENIPLAASFEQSTTSIISTISGDKRSVKRRQKSHTELDTKRIKLESSKSLPNLGHMAVESEHSINVRRSEPINIATAPLTLPPPPAQIKDKNVKNICLRHSPRIKLVPVSTIKFDTSTLRSSTLTQIISPRRSRRSIVNVLPLKPRGHSSKGNSSPRLLVKGRSILTMPKPCKSRSPRSAAYKLQPTSSEEQTKDLRRPLRKSPAVTDLRICRLRRRCRFCTFRYVPVQRLPTGEVAITTVLPPSGVESESSIEGMEPREIPIEEGLSQLGMRKENLPHGSEKVPSRKKPGEDTFQKH